MRERDNVVIYAYKPFCFSKAERFFCCLNVEDIQIIKVMRTVGYRIKNKKIAESIKNLAPAARTVGRFIPSYEAKSASTSGIWAPSCSKRAAYAFY